MPSPSPVPPVPLVPGPSPVPSPVDVSGLYVSFVSVPSPGYHVFRHGVPAPGVPSAPAAPVAPAPGVRYNPQKDSIGTVFLNIFMIVLVCAFAVTVVLFVRKRSHVQIRHQ